ncbi:hypothetical protein ABW18_16130 [Gordonia jacobaea]|uniref:Uncharacterized protein n=1 Tax=Gordonia jacobaea TaxID=122202 RepID=A0ABR5I9Y4_9ACTN|nr:hypothetical protein ABW18_16130 [Gordonia jacobaea]
MTGRRAPGPVRDDIPGTGWVPGGHAPVHRPTTQPLRVTPRPARRSYVPSADAPGAIPSVHPAHHDAPARRPDPRSVHSQRVRVQRRADPSVICAAIAMAVLALTVAVGLIWS